jgi:hypothetical protein
MSPIDYREAAKEAYAKIQEKGVTYIFSDAKGRSEMSHGIFPVLVKELVLTEVYDDILVVYDTYARLAMEDYMRLFDASVDEECIFKGNNNSRIIYTTHKDSPHRTVINFADGRHKSFARSISPSIVVMPDCENITGEGLFQILSFLVQNKKIIIGSSAESGKSKHEFMNDTDEHAGIQRLVI